MPSEDQILYRVVSGYVALDTDTGLPEQEVFSTQGHRTQDGHPCFSVFYKGENIKTPEDAWNLYKKLGGAPAYGVVQISAARLDALGYRLLKDDRGPDGTVAKGHATVVAPADKKKRVAGRIALTYHATSMGGWVLGPLQHPR